MRIEYLVRQPKKLENLSIKRVGDWIALQAGTWMRRAGDREELLSRHIENIRSTIEGNVPRLLHNQLFVEGIRAMTELNNKPSADVSEADKENIVCRMTESLFTKHLSVLHVDFNSSIFLKSLCHKSHLLVSLTELHLRNSSEQHETEFVQILKGLRKHKKLKKLYIRDNFSVRRPFPADKIIECIVKNCKLLEELDVTNSQKDFVRSKNISKLRHLKRINLEHISIPVTEIVNILKSCKNIEHILSDDTDTLVKALELIKTKSSQKSKPEFNLKEFQNNEWMIDERLQLIVSMCPKVQKINFTKYIDNHYLLIPLLDVQSLQELELTNFNFYEDQVKDILEMRGQNLTVLFFKGVKPMSVNELMHIARTCPNLESLTIKKPFGYDRTKPHNTTLLGPAAKAANPSLTKLIKLKYYDCFEFSTESIGEELIFLLCNSPNIEIIDVFGPINDDVMSAVLDANSLTNLQILQTRDSNLSKPVIERILQSCTNFPVIRNIRN